jgi:hypothetical protein
VGLREMEIAAALNLGCAQRRANIRPVREASRHPTTTPIDLQGAGAGSCGQLRAVRACGQRLQLRLEVTPEAFHPPSFAAVVPKVGRAQLNFLAPEGFSQSGVDRILVFAQQPSVRCLP